MNVEITTDQEMNTTPPCKRCGTTTTRQGPGTGPHHARLICAGCGRFLRWLPRPSVTSGGNENVASSPWCWRPA